VKTAAYVLALALVVVSTGLLWLQFSRPAAPAVKSELAPRANQTNQSRLLSEANLGLGDDHPLYNVAISPDGLHVLLAYEDRLLIRDTIDWTDVQFARDRPTKATWAIFCPDNRCILSSDRDGGFCLWELEAGKEILGAEFLASSPLAAMGSPQGAITELFAPRRPFSHLLVGTSIVRRFQGHNGPVTCFALSPDGKKVLSIGEDRLLKLWDLETGQLIRAMGPSLPPRLLAWSPDGKWAMSTFDPWARAAAGLIPEDHEPSDLWRIQVWDVEQGTVVREIRNHPDFVHSIAFSPDGKLALSASTDGTVQLWSVPAWKLFCQLDWPEGLRSKKSLGLGGKWLNSVVFTPDGRYIFGGGDGPLLLWEVASRKSALGFERDPNGVSHVAVFPDGRRALTVGHGGESVWYLRTGREVRTHGGPVIGPAIEIQNVAFVPNHDQVLSTSAEGAVLWDLKSGNPVRQMRGIRFYGSDFISADGEFALSVVPLGLWHLSTGKKLWEMDLPCTATLSPDGQWAAVAPFGWPAKNTLELRDARTGKVLRTIENSEVGQVASLAISPDGRLALSKCYDTKIKVWDLVEAKLLRVLDDPLPKGYSPGFIGDLRFSADGSFAISRHYFYNTWRVSNGSLVSSKPLDANNLPIAYSSQLNASLYVLGPSNCDVGIREAGHQRYLRTLTRGNGPPRQINSAVFSPEGRLVAACGEGNLLLVWETATGTLLQDISKMIKP
jgi:WD40 repeat protein